MHYLKTIWKNKLYILSKYTLSQRSTLWICFNFISVWHKGHISYLSNTIPGSLNHPWEQHLIHVKDVRELGLKDIPSKSVRRPEMRSLTASQHYGQHVSEKHEHSSRNMMIQMQLAEAALQILFPGEDELEYKGRQSCTRLKGTHILDIGCGNAISTKIFMQKGAFCCGLDASFHMMNRSAFVGHGAVDFLLANMGHSLPFRKETFDAIVSISALQWLFSNQDIMNCRRTPMLQLNNSVSGYSTMLGQFFKYLSSILCKDGKVVIQFYPQSIANLVLVLEAASDLNIFHGAIFCIYPHENRGKKLFLYLCQSE